MPLVNTQSELNHDRDLMEFIFLFRLNQSFQFKLIDTISEITRPDKIYPTGPHIVISIDNISLLILNHPFLSVDNLLTLCNVHGLQFASSSKTIARNAIYRAILSHKCTEKCKYLQYTFKMLLTDRRKVWHLHSNNIEEQLVQGKLTRPRQRKMSGLHFHQKNVVQC
jgi:hypothetical protein